MSAMPTDYIAEAITEAYGERCPDFAEGCACCEAWSQYDRLTSATPPDVAGLLDQFTSSDPDKFTAFDRLRTHAVDDEGGFFDMDHAEEILLWMEQAATALRLSAGGGWRPMESAPELDRVIVAGWQKPTRSCAGYWWMHEDVIINGQPDEYPDALLWHPFPSRPAGLPASPTVEAGHAAS